MGASLQVETRPRLRIRRRRHLALVETQGAVRGARSADAPQTGAAPETTRRLLNVVVAAVGILLTAPLMAIIALLVRITSKGPVIYKQMRVGVDRRRFSPHSNFRREKDLGGRPFTIYKFRTMTVDGGESQVWASPDDPRVTPVGRVLRKFRLDELPQLFNVLRGDMNVVGPRPEQPEIFCDLREQINGYADRQQILPGITGWAQIKHHYDISAESAKKKVAFDMEYIARRSAAHDLKIMCLTLPVMISQKGAW